MRAIEAAGMALFLAGGVVAMGFVLGWRRC